MATKNTLLTFRSDKLTAQERRRRRRSAVEVDRSASSGGAVLFFDLALLLRAKEQSDNLDDMGFLQTTYSQVEERETKEKNTIVVSSALLRLRLLGEGKVVVSQRTEGGVINLDSGLVRPDGHLDLEVGHAVQGWLLDPTSNLGLEVEGEVLVGEAKLIVNSQEVAGSWHEASTRVKRSSPAPCTSRCCPRPMPVRLQELEGFSFIYQVGTVFFFRIDQFNLIVHPPSTNYQI